MTRATHRAIKLLSRKETFGVRVSEEEKKQIILDYTENGICITKLAKKYHHNSRLITAILNEYNVPHHRGKLRTGKSNTACKRVFTKEEKEIIKEIYSKDGSNIKQCIDVLHCGQDSLREALKELGLYRSKSEAVKQLPQNQVKYPVKEDFFFEQSHDLAYLLGFLASDGYVLKKHNEIGLGLQITDKEILEKFYNALGGKPLKDFVSNKGSHMSKWEFTSQKVKQELANYGIVNNKTFCLVPPYKLERKYWIDYIRGYFDGDGSVNWLSQNALRWQICSATKEILQWVIDFLYEEYKIPKVNILEQKPNSYRRNTLYYFQYSTNATKAIYDILYTKNSWFLSRKKQKFEEILRRHKAPRDYTSSAEDEKIC